MMLGLALELRGCDARFGLILGDRGWGHQRMCRCGGCALEVTGKVAGELGTAEGWGEGDPLLGKLSEQFCVHVLLFVFCCFDQ